jgi:plastocyanin
MNSYKRFTLMTLFVLFQLMFAQDEHMMHGITINGSDYAFESPETLETGYQTLMFTNTGKEFHHLQLARLNGGVTLEQFQAALQESEFAALPLVEFVGGVGGIAPGQTATTTVYLEKPGTYLELCLIPNAEGVPHVALGMMKTIEVVAATATTDAPQADLVVDMLDFAFTIPGELNAGEQTWEVVNHGEQIHELVLGKIIEGKTLEDVMVYLATGEMGPDAPFSMMGGTPGLSSVHSQFVGFDLTPGEYVTLCFFPDPETGLPHIALGMVSHFTVVEKTSLR